MSTTKDRMKSHRSVRHVPSDSGDYYVRALSLRELEALDSYADEAKTPDERKLRFTRQLLSSAVCEPDGGQVFDGPDDPDMREVDTELLRKLVEEAAEKNNLKAGNDGEEDEGND